MKRSLIKTALFVTSIAILSTLVLTLTPATALRQDFTDNYEAQKDHFCQTNFAGDDTYQTLCEKIVYKQFPQLTPHVPWLPEAPLDMRNFLGYVGQVTEIENESLKSGIFPAGVVSTGNIAIEPASMTELPLQETLTITPSAGTFTNVKITGYEAFTMPSENWDEMLKYRFDGTPSKYVYEDPYEGKGGVKSNLSKGETFQRGVLDISFTNETVYAPTFDIDIEVPGSTYQVKTDNRLNAFGYEYGVTTFGEGIDGAGNTYAVSSTKLFAQRTPFMYDIKRFAMNENACENNSNPMCISITDFVLSREFAEVFTEMKTSVPPVLPPIEPETPELIIPETPEVVEPEVPEFIVPEQPPVTVPDVVNEEPKTVPVEETKTSPVEVIAEKSPIEKLVNTGSKNMETFLYGSAALILLGSGIFIAARVRSRNS